MNVSVYVIGTEITSGIIADRHIPFLCRSLVRLGFCVRRAVVVPDDGSIERELEVCVSDSDVILVTGGLGPTADDLTRRIIARLAGVPLVKDEGTWKQLYAKLGDRAYGANERQAFVPQGFEVVPNPNGTAPGFMGRFERDGHRVFLVSMPGPPAELQPMYLDYIEPHLVSMTGSPASETDVYSVFLIAEAKLDNLCVGCAVEGVSWGTRFGQFGVSLYVRGGDKEKRKEFIHRLREQAGLFLVECGDNVSACSLLEDELEKRHLTISTAESCTAGLLAKLLTDKSGSSSYFTGSAVTYANSAKQTLAGVDEKTLKKYGAVSVEVASQMSGGILERLGTDVSVSVTGIAGPGGATADKPAGTVCLGFSERTEDRKVRTEAVRLTFPYVSRDSSRRRFAVAAFILCRLFLQGADLEKAVASWNL